MPVWIWPNLLLQPTVFSIPAYALWLSYNHTENKPYNSNSQIQIGAHRWATETLQVDSTSAVCWHMQLYTPSLPNAYTMCAIQCLSYQFNVHLHIQLQISPAVPLVPPLPVKIDWSTRRVVDLMEMMRISAGTLSPTGEGGREFMNSSHICVVPRCGAKTHKCDTKNNLDN